jgi:hypothetical protein
MNKNRPKFVQFACDWQPLGYNLHETGGHSVTRQETSRQEVYKRPSLHPNYIFYHYQVQILNHASDYSSDGPWILSLENELALHMNDKVDRKQILHPVAASCVQSRQFFVRTII